jgi:N-methylhydantoinase B
VARSYRVLSDTAQLQLRSDRVRFAPYGLAGGQPGRATRNEIETAGQAAPLPGKVTMTVRKGQLIRHEQAGGGGHGDPLARAPAAVAADVWNRKITAGYARARHRVVVDPETGALDAEATAALRAG